MGSHQQWNGYYPPPPFPPPPQAEFPDPRQYAYYPYHQDYPQPAQYSQLPLQYYAPPSQSPHPQEQPRHAYADPRSPVQSAFNPAQMFSSMPGAFDYQMPLPEVSGLSLDDRPGSPQYVGRRARSKPRSRASSKASNTTRPTSRVDTRRGTVRGRKKAIAPPPAPPPGYKPPSVETAPNSPNLLPSLASDSSTIFVEDDDYQKLLVEATLREQAREAAAREAAAKRRQQKSEPKPLKRAQEPEFAEPEPEPLPSLERDRTPYASSSATVSTAASSPPPEKLPLERERRIYSATKQASDTGRESRRHSYVERAPPSPPIELERQRRQYGGPSYEHYSDGGTDQTPPETAPRQPQPYSMPPDTARQSQGYSMPPEAMPRQSQPYSLHPDTPPPTSREPQPYASHIETPPPPRQPQPYASHPKTPPPQPAPRPAPPYPTKTPPPQPAPPLRHRKSQGFARRPETPPLQPRQPQPYAQHTEAAPPPLRHRKSQGHSLRVETQPTRPPQTYPATETAPRQSQPYSMTPDSAGSRQSHPYASSSTSSGPRRAQQQYRYSASATDLTYSREDLRTPQSSQATQSPQQPHSPRFPDPQQYTQSPLNTRSPQTSSTSRFDAPSSSRHETHTPATSSEPSPKTPAQETFGGLIHRPTTPQSEYLGLIPACPKKWPVSRGRWYGVPGIPNFHVCEKCYELHIYDTAFVKYFTDFKLSNGQKTHCAFNTPRVLKFVWPKTVEENHFDIFKSYALERSAIGSCTSIDSTAKKGVWYTIHGNPRGGFIACQACYQDVILASPFHQFFVPLEATVSGNTISCHVAWPFIEARLLNTPANWEETQADIEYRLLSVPGCPGNKLVQDNGRRWWKLKGPGKPPLYICDCCYWDGVFPTLFANQFEAAAQGSRDMWCCAMSGYQLSTVWQYAAEQEDMKPWLDAAEAALSPMCVAQGSTGKIWNVFKDPELDGFDFCERCAEVFIRPLGFGPRLEKRRYASSESIKCDLNPANEYQGKLLQMLGEAAAWRDFDILKKYLLQLAPEVYHPPVSAAAVAPPPPPPSYPPCPGAEYVCRNRWYGRDSFNVCEQCYRERVKPSSLGPWVKEFDCYGEPMEAQCDLGMPDWRAIWQKRCQTNDMGSFLEAVKLKKELDNIRIRRHEANEEMATKARRGLFPDERRRMQGRLSELQEEERDTTNMLAVLTRI
ncbi:hypothetical protein FN846DRAFT_539642 [Sphaerosporella brunnea]|uniref:Integral membrane protein n=1 Tax=Sphaerosporella brunnea TaxID=1250544 RepID=A0A5J5F2U3_9PEZI|nr:hypothetical protein FN846DRAFT_539642 [Sphaerosporella brunnea]